MENKPLDCVFIAQLTTKTGVIFENLFCYDCTVEDFHDAIACGEVISFETETGAIVEMSGDNIDFWVRCDDEDFSFFMDFDEDEKTEEPKKKPEKKETGKKAENKVIDIEAYRKNKNKPK